jgi:hypothetical protein
MADVRFNEYFAAANLDAATVDAVTNKNAAALFTDPSRLRSSRI